MSSSNPLLWRKPPVILGYGISVLSVVAALAISHWPAFHLGSAPVSLFLCAVMFSAWFSGVGPGLLATVLSALAFYDSFLPPIDSLAAKPDQMPRFVIFIVSALFVGLLSVAQRKAAESLRRTRDHLNETVQQLKKTNEALGKSEAYLAEAQTLSHTGSFGWNVSTGELFWSEESFRIFGYDRALKPTVQLALERVHPEDVRRVQEAFDGASHGKDLDLEHRLVQLAQITRDRYQSLLTQHAVAQQDVDNAVGTYSANKTIVDADTANVRHYEALVSFEKVYAPFDGVITARNTDIGDLINSGSSTAPRTDLFDIVQTRTLRVYLNVPEEYSQGVKPGGTSAEIALAEFPGKRFPGRLVRTAQAINATTRTLLVEVDLDNPGGTLLSGSYAEVHLQIPAQNSTFLLPVSSLIFRGEKLQVGVVRNGKVAVTDVTPGHDFGDQIEIVAGLKADDQVVVNPPDSLVSGQSVKTVEATLPGDSQ